MNLKLVQTKTHPSGVAPVPTSRKPHVVIYRQVAQRSLFPFRLLLAFAVER